MSKETDYQSEPSPPYAQQQQLLADLQAEQAETLRQHDIRIRVIESLSRYDQDRLRLLGLDSPDLRMVIYYLIHDPAGDNQTIGVHIESRTPDSGSKEQLRAVNIPVASVYSGMVLPYGHGTTSGYFEPQDCDIVYGLAAKLEAARSSGLLPDLSYDGMTINAPRNDTAAPPV